MEECNPNKLCVRYTFGMFIPFSATYFLDIRAFFSLKIASNGHFKSKKSVES